MKHACTRISHQIKLLWNLGEVSLEKQQQQHKSTIAGWWWIVSFEFYFFDSFDWWMTCATILWYSLQYWISFIIFCGNKLLFCSDRSHFNTSKWLTLDSNEFLVKKTVPIAQYVTKNIRFRLEISITRVNARSPFYFHKKMHTRGQLLREAVI